LGVCEIGIEGHAEQSPFAGGIRRHRTKTASPAAHLVLMTRRAPFCWQTNRRPSGANAMAVALEIPLAMTDSLKPGRQRGGAEAVPTVVASSAQNRWLAN
jgi:hypothetical protein